MATDTSKALELARLELLDMGLRGNTLLHLRSSAKTLDVIDEVSTEVFKILVENQKSMSFLAAPERESKSGDTSIEEAEKAQEIPLPQLLEELYGPDRHTDNRLQTKLTNDQLDMRLLKISTEAHTYYEEQGVDILYLALAFLHWYEDENSTQLRKAPLVLIPVELKRSSASDKYKLSYTEADIGPNLTLAAKLKSEFRVTLPEFGEHLVIQDYLDEVSENISANTRWRVSENEISLGFFSFGKFQMYQDLDSETWPENKKPEHHPLMISLMGGGFAYSDESAAGYGGASGESYVEGTPSLVELNFVKDADSSQTEAVLAVKGGANLVIQGPPGTGKSQTITNIISESLSDGKRILFVAEKMAALEVVKRRLDECHLGDAVLELHSHKSNKKAIVEELKRTLELGAPNVPSREYEKRRYQEAQLKLDGYAEAVNTGILKSDVTYIEALGSHLQLQKHVSENQLPYVDFDLLRDFSGEEFAATCREVDKLVNHLVEMGVPAENAFATTSLTEFSPVKQSELSSLLLHVNSLIEKCNTRSREISKDIGLLPPASINEIQTLHRAATRAVQAPHIAGISLTTDDWQQRRDRIKELLEAGSKMALIKQGQEEILISQAWDSDVLSDRAIWASKGGSWWRSFSGDFRRAKARLLGLTKSELPKDSNQCLAIIDDILEYQSEREKFRKQAHLGASIFGAQWEDEASDWKVLSTISEWVIEIYNEVGRGAIPIAILSFLEGDPEISDWSPRLEELSSDASILENRIAALVDQLQVSLPGEGGASPCDVDLESLVDLMQVWNKSADDLYRMTRYNRILMEFDSPALKRVAHLSYSWTKSPDLLLSTIKASWFGGLVEEAYSQRKELRHFDRVEQEKLIRDFREMDNNLFNHAQESLVGKLHEQLPSSSGAGEVAVIRKEMNKKRRHLPIRKLIQQAGRAIQQIKPVFMMSPMSVATYLEQGAVEFDLVVFDEASQVKVVDAIGSILRSEQVVVVGDTKQMPPTDFFGKAIELDDEKAEESETADIESILGMFLAQGAPEVMLRWHYRSRHDSLIAVSNEEFYNGNLMIFPSPGVNPQASGLRYRYLPETQYERGGSRTNPDEARAVAEAVMEHAEARAELTLGVVAFSTAQRDRILLEIERLRRARPDLEGFFNRERATGESFFVKNLENVQGDERDVIYISIAYGRTSAGNVSQSFGPVNREGGERRLNVLITRARLSMEVFTNLTADDLKITGKTPFGVRSLRNFLKYAETGELERPLETGHDTDSPFEDEVLDEIRKMGYDVEPQVGSAGFFIDMAVRDPEKPGRFVLAVECDGATYHSSASARDRDRLRQSVLEGLGWRFHRIWSTDWFRNPVQESERLKHAIDAAIEALTNGQASIEPIDDLGGTPLVGQHSIERVVDVVVDQPVPVYQICEIGLSVSPDTELHELSDHIIHSAADTILKTEGPVHVEVLGRRIADAAGVSRIGNRISSRLNAAVDSGARASLFFVEDGFLYLTQEKVVTLRDRSELPAPHKKIEFVPPGEIAMAVRESVAHAFSLDRQDAISEALSLLGFQRATKKASMLVSSVIDQLVASGEVHLDNEKLVKN